MSEKVFTMTERERNAIAGCLRQLDQARIDLETRAITAMVRMTVSRPTREMSRRDLQRPERSEGRDEIEGLAIEAQSLSEHLVTYSGRLPISPPVAPARCG